MAIVVKDRVQETTTTTGLSDFVLLGAVGGFQSFAAIGNTNTTYYAAVDPATGEWEVGVGTYSTTGPTLTRNSILSSSAAGAKINFASGSKNVFCTYPSEKAIYEEVDGATLIDGGPITVLGTGVTVIPSLPAELGKFVGNIDSFAQIYTLNENSGSSASADFVAYNDQTTDGNNYFTDMGINSSNYTSGTYPIFTKNSGYVFHDGDHFFIGNQTPNKDVVLFAGGADTTNEVLRLKGADQTAEFASDVTATGNLNAAGGAFTAAVTTTSPSTVSPANNEFVTKSYVDTATSTGIHIHTPVYAETSAALSAVYVQGGTTFNITDITGGDTVVTSTTHGLSVNDQIWLTTTAGNGLSINTPYFVYSTPTGTSLKLSLTYGGVLLTGLTNATGLSYATRANSGVGAYLESSANATFTIGAIPLTVGDRILVYQQTPGYWDGVYTITSLGSGSSKWKLTRATDQDKYAPQDTAGLGEGDYFLVTTNSESYVLTTEGSIIIGYTPLTYTLFSSAPVYTGGTNIDITGGVISLTGTVAATNGGTGVNTVTTGDLLYGSATNTWGKLGIGAAYKSLVVNAGGTNVEWNAVALGQSGAVSGTLPATNGGTGLFSYATGDIIYSSAANTLSALAGNTNTTKKFLSQTGTGSASQAPSWEQPAASDITGLAPSATTDTTNAANITSGTLPTGRISGSYTGLTGVGTLTAGTWNASTIGVTYGGTGLTSYAVGDLLYADTTTSLAKLADVAVGNALISGGVSSAPSWGKIGLATHVSGTLPIASGGTNGAATPTAGAVAYGTGSAYDFSAAGSSGQALLSGATGAPTWGTLGFAAGGTGQTSYTDGQLLIGNTSTGGLTKATITAGTGVSVTNGNGSITIAASSGATTGIYQNPSTITTNQTISSGNNGMSAGVITIASGVTVTIASGSRWVVV